MDNQSEHDLTEFTRVTADSLKQVTESLSGLAAIVESLHARISELEAQRP